MDCGAARAPARRGNAMKSVSTVTIVRWRTMFLIARSGLVLTSALAFCIIAAVLCVVRRSLLRFAQFAIAKSDFTISVDVAQSHLFPALDMRFTRRDS